MKKITQPIVLLLSLAISVFSCDQIIEIDLPKQDPVLVVNSTFTPDSTWEARVTSSQSIQVSTPPKPVSNATLWVIENGIVIDTLKNDSDDHYSSVLGTHPIVGHSYTMQASAPDFATVSGTDFVPSPVIPFGMAWRDSVSYNQFDGYSGEFSFKINDIAGTDNYYVLNVYTIDTIFDLNDTILYLNSIYLQIQDPILSYDAFSNALLFNDVTFDGMTRTIKVQMPSDQHLYSPLMFFGLSTVSKSYFQYMKTMSSYYETGFNPFAEPVRVFSNMTPGMGIFAGYSVAFDLVP